MIKNLLIQRETEEDNQKTGVNMPLIDREHSGDVLLIDSEHSGDVPFIYRKLAELEDDAECASFSKLTEFVKKLSNLTRTGKKNPYRPISHSLNCFIMPIKWLCFSFTEGLVGLTDGLAIDTMELRGGKVAVGFFG